MRFLSVASGSWPLSVQGALPNTPWSLSGLAASMARNAESMHAADIARGCSYVAPVRPCGDDRIGRICSIGGVAFVTSFVERLSVILVPDVGEAFEEHQREDVLLVVTRIHEATQERGGTPEVAFQYALGELVNGGGIMHHAERSGGPVAAAQKCATHGPLSACGEGQEMYGDGALLRRFDWRLSTRV